MDVNIFPPIFCICVPFPGQKSRKIPAFRRLFGNFDFSARQIERKSGFGGVGGRFHGFDLLAFTTPSKQARAFLREGFIYAAQNYFAENCNLVQDVEEE